MHTTIQAAADSQQSAFDQALSTTLDISQLQLDAQPGWLRRLLLRMLKRWHERQVPAIARPQPRLEVKP